MNTFCSEVLTQISADLPKSRDIAANIWTSDNISDFPAIPENIRETIGERLILSKFQQQLLLQNSKRKNVGEEKLFSRFPAFIETSARKKKEKEKKPTFWKIVRSYENLQKLKYV